MYTGIPDTQVDEAMWQGKFDLNDRNVVVTGGASGIGFALAKGLGSRGCRIMIAEPSEQRLESAATALGESGTDALCG